MNFKLSIANEYARVKTDCLVLGCFSDQKRWPGSLPTATRKQLTALQGSGDLSGKPGEARWLYRNSDVSAGRILLIGCGSRADWAEKAYRAFLGAAARQLLQSPVKTAAFSLPGKVHGRAGGWHASQLASALTTAGYRYHRTISKPAARPSAPRPTNCWRWACWRSKGIRHLLSRMRWPASSVHV